jgi:hypothetical protein
MLRNGMKLKRELVSFNCETNLWYLTEKNWFFPPTFVSFGYVNLAAAGAITPDGESDTSLF